MGDLATFPAALPGTWVEGSKSAAVLVFAVRIGDKGAMEFLCIGTDGKAYSVDAAAVTLDERPRRPDPSKPGLE